MDAADSYGNDEVTTASIRKIRFRCDVPATTILDVLKDRGWTQVEGEDDSWNLYWVEVGKLKETMDQKRLQPNQRVPHFRNHYELTRKNLLARNLKRFKRKAQRENRPDIAEACECMPLTFELPGEYLMFVEEYRKQPGATWIVKPATGCQGRGIFLFNRLKDLNDWRRETSLVDVAPTPGTAGDQAEVAETWVVQRYLEKPYLLGGRKFDLRVYVLVTSFNPLKVWMAREGFARLCGYNYSLDSLSNNRVHLTNMAIQLKASSGEDEASPGSKWSLRCLRRFLVGRHGVKRVEQLLQDIGAIVVTSLQSVQHVIMNDKHCFELYGYDVLLDADLRPWLLEVNASPSLSPTDPADYVMKYNLLEDTLNIVDLERRLTGTERRVGGFDVIWSDGMVTLRCPGASFCGETAPYVDSLDTNRLNVHLGGSNDREVQLYQLQQRRQLSRVLASLSTDPPSKKSQQPDYPSLSHLHREHDDQDMDLYFRLRDEECEVW